MSGVTKPTGPHVELKPFGVLFLGFVNLAERLAKLAAAVLLHYRFSRPEHFLWVPSLLERRNLHKLLGAKEPLGVKILSIACEAQA